MTPPEASGAAGFTVDETARLCREMYELGREHAEAELAGQWARATAPICGSPDQAELEERRWGPGGRARFADPRPGDFPGRAQPQPEPEAEPELEVA